MTVIPCQNVVLVWSPHAELNVYSFLFCFYSFYYILSPKYSLAFGDIRLLFFYSVQAKWRPCSLRVEMEFFSSLVCSWLICLRLHQEALNSAMWNYTRSLVHVMLWTSQGLLSWCRCWLLTVKSLSWFSKPGSSYPSMMFTISSLLQQNTSTLREE